MGAGRKFGQNARYQGVEGYSARRAAVLRFGSKVAHPSGSNVPSALLMPQAPGSLANTNLLFVSAQTVGGAVNYAPAQGSATGTLTALAIGGLIAGASGVVSCSVAAVAQINSPASAFGTATATATTSALLGAIAGLTGSTLAAVVATALPYATGSISGSTEDTGALTPAQIAASVWAAFAGDNNAPGTMGEKLNDAGSAGNPWAALLADNIDPDTFGKLVQDILKQAKLAAALSA